MEHSLKVVRVGRLTDPVKLATSLLTSLEEGNIIKVCAIGSEAVSVIGKALPYTEMFKTKGNIITYVPGMEFQDTDFGCKNVFIWTLSYRKKEELT